MKTVTIRLDSLEKVKIPLGFVGENLHRRIIFVCDDAFKEYPNATATITVESPAGVKYPGILVKDCNNVYWDIRDSDVAVDGNGQIQLTFTEGVHVKKEYKTRTFIEKSIVANSPAPDPVEDWVEQANETLEDLAAMDNIAKNAQESDIGKSLSPKTVVDGVVTEWQYTEPSGGTDDYTDLNNKPQIAGVTLSGNKSLTDLGIASTESLGELSGEVTNVKNDIHGLAPAATDNAKGAVASFSDGANNLPLNHLKVQIVPVQAGSGDPSPTNKRNITGRTGQTISHSAEDTTNPTEYEDSWEDEAGTVFYGKRDIITGQLIIEAIMLTFDGSSDEGWTYNAYNDYNKYRYYISVSSYGVDYGDNKQDVLFCNWLRPEVNGAQTTYTYGTNIVCMSPSRQWLFVALDISTVDALKAELALNPLQVVIKLATQSTYSLAPVEIDSLYGVNKFWSDAGNIIQCEYKADTSLFVKDEIDSRNVEPQMTVKATTLEDDTITVIDGLMIRKNLDIEFMASITDFTSLIIGHGYNQDGAAYIVIDSTNVTVYANSGTQKAQYAHGLTIGTYIRVLIQQDDNALARLLIFTASGTYTKADIDFNGCTGDIFATVDGELSDVSLTAVLHDINKPIWFFGDSYQSMTKDGTSRWPYYLRDEGYIVNTLFAGRYGAFAQTLVPTFHKLLAIKKPKFIVWCLGMNGSDTNGNLNMQWRDATNDVIDTCAEEGVTLILATIPNTPDRNNTKKNAYVKNTGLRYIDFAKAVGAEEAGSSWYTGMLSTDDLHPSATGAMALYAQVLADLPEVMQSVKRGYEVWEGGSY